MMSYKWLILFDRDTVIDVSYSPGKKSITYFAFLRGHKAIFLRERMVNFTFHEIILHDIVFTLH